MCPKVGGSNEPGKAAFMNQSIRIGEGEVKGAEIESLVILMKELDYRPGYRYDM